MSRGAMTANDDTARASLAPGAAASAGGNPLLNPYFLLALAALCWSGNHVLGRAIAGHVPPFATSTVRWIVPMVLLWPFARAHLRRDWPVIRRHWKIFVFLGLAGGSVFSVLQYIALQYTTALNTSVLNSLGPIFIVMIGAAMFGDRLAPRQALGIAVSLSGVAVIVTKADVTTLGALGLNWGDLLIVINMAAWGFYAAFLRLRPAVHWLSYNFIFAAVSTISTLPFFAWEHAAGYRFELDMLTLVGFAYVGIFPSFVAFAAWARGTETIGANRSGPFLHLIPLYSALLAYAFIGEQLRAYHVLGFALIMAGVWMAAREARTSAGVSG